MNCNELADILSEDLIATLSPERRTEVLSHAGGCDDCTDAMAAHRALYAEALPEEPADLLPNVLAAIARRSPEPAWPQHRAKRAVAITASMFALGGAVFAAVMLSDMIGEDPDQAVTATIAAPAEAADASDSGTTGDDGPESGLIEYVEAVEAAEQQAFAESFMSVSGLPDGEFFSLLKVAPFYPEQAVSQGVEGFAIVEFTVTENGDIADPEIVDSSHEFFEQTSIEAVRQFKYKPRIVNGAPVAVEGVRNRIVYMLETPPADAVSDESEQSASERRSHVQPDADNELDWRQFRVIMQPTFECLLRVDLRCVEFTLDEIAATHALSAQQEAQIWRIYGFVEHRRGNYESAIAAYLRSARSLEANPGDFSKRPLMIAARIYHDRQQYQQALDTAIEFLKASSNPSVSDYVFVDRLRQLGATVR